MMSPLFNPVTGIEFPPIGFGTSGLSDEECTEAVTAAIEHGYRHIDTAQMYENEAAVGEAIAQSDIERDELIIATKVNPPNLAYDDVIHSTKASLDRLGVSEVDLLYVHWPIDAYDPEDTLDAIDEVSDRGWTRHIGVSNFTVPLLEEAIELLDAPIAAHQVELHPLLPQAELRAYGQEHGHWVVGYCPVLQGGAAEVGELVTVADRRGITPSQVALAWALHLGGVVPIPKARGDHIGENLAATAVELTEEDLELIDSIDHGRRLVDPDSGPWNR